jgi:hypothetical protein
MVIYIYSERTKIVSVSLPEGATGGGREKMLENEKY